MQSVTLSQKGSKSERNEDACLALPSRRFFVLADGVGGGPNGDFASRTTVDALYDDLSGADVSEPAILASISRANELVFASAQSVERRGMATTLAACWINASTVYCFNVGDSRVYRLDGESLKQLTRDHTKQVQKAANVIKQVVTNALGVRATVNVEVTTSNVNVGDVLFLATDGITDLMDDEALLEILNAEQLSLAEKAQAVIAESERRGGRDDKSVILTVVG